MSSNSGMPDDDSLFWEGHRVLSIIIFSAIFIILTFYSIFSCYYFYRGPRTSSSTNRASRGDLNEPDPGHDHHHSVQIQGRGLELWVIASLPTSQFKKNDGSNRVCAICLAEFEEQEWVKILPSCAHVFHVICIATWFRSHTNCPICRSNVNNDLLALSSDSSVSYYTSPCETLSREDFSPERLSLSGRHTTAPQPTSCSS